MKGKKMDKTLASLVAKMAKDTLKAEANSTSCTIVYQPKAPKELNRFKK